MCVNKVLSAWTEVWNGTSRARASIVAPEGRSGQIFEILGGAGDINNSISTANYRDGPYGDLVPGVNKGFSAWTEVWTAP